MDRPNSVARGWRYLDPFFRMCRRAWRVVDSLCVAPRRAEDGGAHSRFRYVVSRHCNCWIRPCAEEATMSTTTVVHLEIIILGSILAMRSELGNISR